MSQFQDETFTIMSIQHELGMTIGSSFHLEEMLTDFGHAALKCMNVQGIAFCFHDSFDTAPPLQLSIPKQSITHEAPPPQTDSSPVYWHTDTEHFHSFRIGKLGVMTLKRRTVPLSNTVIFGLLPIIDRLELACLACMEHDAVISEIEERSRIQKELVNEKERIATTLNSIADAVISTDSDGGIAYLNPVAETLLNVSLAEVRKQPITEFLTLGLDTQETTDKDLNKELQTHLSHGKPWSWQQGLILTNSQNETRGVELSAAPILHGSRSNKGHVIIIHDVSHKREIEQQISWQATHDALTQLPNRSEFETRLKALFNTSKSREGNHALLYIDLDQFKVVNDTCGHLAGDGLLQRLANLMNEQIREADTLARIGGDEFAVILQHCPMKTARELAEKIRKAVQEFRYTWEEKIFTVGVSIGMVPITAETLDADKVFAQADLACYAAKDHGRNQVYLYQEKEGDFTVQRQGEMEWISRINNALEHNNLILFCQGIYPLDKDLPIHLEVLLRMREGEDIIPPGAFLPAAERYGKIHALDLWVVTTVVQTIARDPMFTSEDSPYRININLAGPTLSDNETLAAIEELMLAYPGIAKIICLEITETSAITNINACLTFMEKLTAIGCQFILDDFGSGLSSFSYLKNLPVSQVKIDGEFVKDISVDKIDRAMVTSIHQIAQSMSILTVAEFVEDDVTLEILKEIGIDFGQGYGIEMPLKFSEKIQQLKDSIPGQPRTAQSG